MMSSDTNFTNCEIILGLLVLGFLLLLYFGKDSYRNTFCSASSCNDLGVSRYNMAAIRDDTGSRDMHAKDGFRANKNKRFTSALGFDNNANMEPPVFWNSGNYQLIGDAEHDAAQQGFTNGFEPYRHAPVPNPYH